MLLARNRSRICAGSACPIKEHDAEVREVGRTVDIEVSLGVGRIPACKEDREVYEVHFSIVVQIG